MQRTLILIYGAAAYLAFVATITYAIGFVGNFIVPQSIDVAPARPWPLALAVNAGLMLLFAVQHTIMARAGSKAWITRYIPAAAERSTFVLAASLTLALAMWQWRPLGGVIWHSQTPWVQYALIAVSLLGWALVLYSSFVIDHFDLFGLRQVWLNFRGKPYTHHPFAVRNVYRYVRHPLMLGFLIAVWSTPLMTMSHLLFALLITAYVFVGVRFEERDLRRHFGTLYAQYARATPMLLPRLWRRPAPVAFADAGPNGRVDRVVAAAKGVGVAGFLFFLGKGLLWLALPALIARTVASN